MSRAICPKCGSEGRMYIYVRHNGKTCVISDLSHFQSHFQKSNHHNKDIVDLTLKIIAQLQRIDRARAERTQLLRSITH